MCLAIPVKVVSIGADSRGKALLGGVEVDVALDLIEDVQVGDYVIVHVGFAIAKLDVAEAETTLALFAELAAFQDEAAGSGASSQTPGRSVSQAAGPSVAQAPGPSVSHAPGTAGSQAPGSAASLP